MVSSILTILGFLLPLLLEWWQQEAKVNEDDQTKQVFIEALAGGDARGLSLAFERLREQAGRHGDPGRSDDPGTTRR